MGSTGTAYFFADIGGMLPKHINFTLLPFVARLEQSMPLNDARS
jgi:hypothetical protein